jgi:hypothetical protein
VPRQAMLEGFAPHANAAQIRDAARAPACHGALPRVGERIGLDRCNYWGGRHDKPSRSIQPCKP